MRGFHRKMLGPLDQNGAPLGGDALFLGSIEFRIPVVWRLRAALFADAGQVWARANEVSPRQIEVAVGPGLMLQTPVGPIRVDFGHRVRKVQAGQPDNVLQLSLGEPF